MLDWVDHVNDTEVKTLPIEPNSAISPQNVPCGWKYFPSKCQNQSNPLSKMLNQHPSGLPFCDARVNYMQGSQLSSNIIYTPIDNKENNFSYLTQPTSTVNWHDPRKPHPIQVGQSRKSLPRGYYNNDGNFLSWLMKEVSSLFEDCSIICFILNFAI
jgi:hypothetical protein